MNKPWNDEEELDLLEMRDTIGFTWSEIAEELDRTVSACRNKYAELVRELNRSEAA